MTFLRGIILLQFATAFALGQLVQPNEPPKVSVQHEAVVRNLYHEVVARHPNGVPRGADMNALTPYLSKGLIRRLDSAQACEDDYYRRRQDPKEKPQMKWFEVGLFSGGNEKALPVAFYVEGSHPEKDGSFRVHVRLRYGGSLNWHVAVIVVRENGHFVVDDVVFLKDETLDVESRLSQLLAVGCDGPRSGKVQRRAK